MCAWWYQFWKGGQKPSEAAGVSIAVPVRLLQSLATRHRAMDAQGIEHALIGGCALAAHRVVRATADVDFLVEGEHEPRLHAYMVAEGFEVLLRTENVSNYWAPSGERIDFVHARRRYTREMLAAARPYDFGNTQVRVIGAEDLIGLKVQASSNDPSRMALDMSDISKVIREHQTHMDMARVRMYFSIFKREGELDEMLRAF